MVYKKERPICRKAINNLMKKYNCTLHELMDHPSFSLSDGLRIQIRKMLQEEKQEQMIANIQYTMLDGKRYPVMLCQEYKGQWRFMGLHLVIEMLIVVFLVLLLISLVIF